MTELEQKSRMLCNKALADLEQYPNLGAYDHFKRLGKRALGQIVPPYDRLNWPSGLLANALARYYQNNLYSEVSLQINHALVRYYKRFINSHQKIYYLDNALAGFALIDTYEFAKEECFDQLLKQLVVYLKQHPTDDGGSLPYRPNANSLDVLVDSVGMICPFLCKYGKTFHDPGATALAVKQMTNFLDYGIDEVSGLPYHGYNYKSRIKKGIIGWGRGVGWLMIGLIDSLEYLTPQTPEYDRFKQSFRYLVDKVESYQRSDGMYAWQLAAKSGEYDTSATAMITYAIARGLEQGILIGIHKSRMLKGRAALLSAIEDGVLTHSLAECLDFGMYPQKYGVYPWGIGPALSLFCVDVKE